MSIQLNNTPLQTLVISITGLVFAFFVEYVMGLAVCPLCIYQRFPYLILIMLAIISLSGQQNLWKYYIATASCAILLAAYHTGIERGIFDISALCTPLVSVTDALSVEDFKKMLYSEPIGTCSKPALVIFGFSLTEWNLLLNVCLLTMFVRAQIIKE